MYIYIYIYIYIYSKFFPGCQNKKTCNSFVVPIYGQEISKKSISYLECKIWNGLDKSIKISTSTNIKHTNIQTNIYIYHIYVYVCIYIYIYK